MHVTCGDRADEAAIAFCAYRERHKNWPSGVSPSDRNQSMFTLRVLWIWRDPRPMFKNSFDLCDGHTMPLAFRAVAVIPVEPVYFDVHNNTMLYKCIYIIAVSRS